MTKVSSLRLSVGGGIACLMTAPALLNAALTGTSAARVNGFDPAPRRGLRQSVVQQSPAPQLPVLPTPPAALPAPTNQNVSGYLKASGTGFAVNGAPYAFGGTNDFSAALVHLYTDAQVGTMMQAHAQKGARVIRFFAFSNGNGAGSVPTPQPIQPTPGVFDEVALERLDLVIASAAQNGMRVIMPLVNFEPALGGMQWYVDNVLGVGRDKEIFYTDPQVKQAYKNYVSLLVNRTNTVTGIPYKSDPAIAAWELSNEVHTTDFYEQSRGQTPGQLANNWLSEMSGFIKGLGIAQMLSTGEEGYRTDGDTTGSYNSWINGGSKGVNFVANTNLPNIDFATVHYYPDNWEMTPDNYVAYSNYFLADRAAIAHQAGKPIIMEESGLGYLNSFAGFDRDTFLTNIYGIADGQGFAGEMVWQAWPAGTSDVTGYDFTYDESGGQAVTAMFQKMATAQAAAGAAGREALPPSQG